MQRIKNISFWLPACQVTLAGVLLILARHSRPPMRLDTPYLPTTEALCYGVNGPATLVRSLFGWLVAIVGLPIPSFFQANSYALDEIPYYCFIWVQWWIVARSIPDSSIPPGSKIQKPMRSPKYVITALLGGTLLLAVVGRIMSKGDFNNPFAYRMQTSLFLGWAVALLYLSFRGLVLRWRSNGVPEA